MGPYPAVRVLVDDDGTASFPAFQSSESRPGVFTSDKERGKYCWFHDSSLRLRTNRSGAVPVNPGTFARYIQYGEPVFCPAGKKGLQAVPG
jgi:hypothetical protein